jgi:hypothetical protein
MANNQDRVEKQTHPFKTAATTNIITVNSGNSRTVDQLAAALGVTGNLARAACEAGVAAGTLDRLEGGGLPLRYAQHGKGV